MARTKKKDAPKNGKTRAPFQVRLKRLLDALNVAVNNGEEDGRKVKQTQDSINYLLNMAQAYGDQAPERKGLPRPPIVVGTIGTLKEDAIEKYAGVGGLDEDTLRRPVRVLREINRQSVRVSFDDGSDEEGPELIVQKGEIA